MSANDFIPESVCPRPGGVDTLSSCEPSRSCYPGLTDAGGTADWLLAQTLDGGGRFGAVDADPGTIILVRPGTPHDYGTRGRRWHLVYAHFHPKPEWSPLLDWPEVAPGILQLRPADPAAERIAGHLRDAVRHQRSVL